MSPVVSFAVWKVLSTAGHRKPAGRMFNLPPNGHTDDSLFAYKYEAMKMT
jgi:hypothetical protein